MSDIFQEVDEALQQEKIEKIWKDYKNTILACIALLIGGAALGSVYHGWNNGRNSAETGKLLTALESNSPQAALAEIAKNSRSPHEAVALLSAANMALEENKKDQSLTHLKTLMDQRGAPQILRDYARISYAQLGGEKALDALKPLLSDKKSPWHYHARLESAILHAAEENYAQAIDSLKDFSDITTLPLSLKQRAEALMAVYRQKNSNKTQKDAP